MRRLGFRVAVLRRERRITQEELATVLGCSRSSVQRLERCGREASIAELVALADLFDVNMLDLLDAPQDRMRLETATPDLRRLVAIYRQLGPGQRAALVEIAADLLQVERALSGAPPA